MIKFLKSYLPMIISILFFFIYSGLIRLIFLGNINETTNNYIMYMIFMFTIIIIFIIEMIYFIIKAATNKNIKDNVLWAVLIYLFNVFIIPYYNFKYVVKSKKIKIDMSIYIGLSIIALILGFMTPTLILKTDNNTNIKEILYLEENNIKFKFIGNYVEEKDIGEYDLYAIDYNRLINIGIYIYDEEYEVTLDEIQSLNSDYIQKTRNDSKLISAYSEKLDNRNIMSEVIKAEYQKDVFAYKISTIEFKEYDYIINIIMITYADDYEQYEDEFEQFLLDVEVVE